MIFEESEGSVMLRVTPNAIAFHQKYEGARGGGFVVVA